MSRAVTVNIGAATTTFIVDGVNYSNNEVGDEIYINKTDEAVFGSKEPL